MEDEENNIFTEYRESGEAARVAEAVANSNSDYFVLTGTFVTTYTSNACETSGEWLVRISEDDEEE